jgi:PAS domain S-box-containing protein
MCFRVCRPRPLRALLVWVACLLAVPLMAQELRIGVMQDDALEVNENWPVLERYLVETLDVARVSVRPYPRNELDLAMRSGSVDAVITDGLHYVVNADRMASLVAAATLIKRTSSGLPVEGLGGTALVLRERSDLQALADLQGLKVATADVSLLAGFQSLAREMLKQGDEGPPALEVQETGQPHASAVQALLAREVDAAFVRAGTLEALLVAGRVAPETLRVLEPLDLPGYPWQLSSRLYPGFALLMMPHLDPALARRLVGALLLIEPGGDLAGRLGIYGFGLPLDYGGVIELARQLRLPPYEHRQRVTFAQVWSDHRAGVLMLFALLGVILLALGLSLHYGRVLRHTQGILRERSQELQTQQQHLKTLLDTIPDLVFMKDSAGVFLFANPVMEKLVGRSAEQIVDHTDFDFFPADIAEAFRRADQETMAAGQVNPVEEWLRSPDGSIDGRYLTLKTPVCDASGEVIGILGVSRDITALRDAEYQLQERLKEQGCLHTVFHVTEDIDAELEPMFEQVAQALRQGMRYPEQVAVRLAWNEVRVHAGDAEVPGTRLSRSFTVVGLGQGTVDLACAPAAGQSQSPDFIDEEVQLLDRVVDRLRSVLQRRLETLHARERDAVFRGIVSKAVEAVVLVSVEDLRIVEFNDSAASQLGYGHEEFARLRLPDIQGEMSEAEIRQKIADFEEAGGAEFQSKRRCKDGSLRDVRVGVSTLILRGRSFISIIWNDITEHLRAEQALLERQQQFRAAIESTSDGFWAVNTEGQIIEVNGAFCRMVGCAHEDVIGQFVWQFDARDGRDEVLSRMAALQETGAASFETVMRRLDGSEFPAEVIVSWSEGSDGRFYVFIRDITQRRANEEELHAYRNHLEEQVAKRTLEAEAARHRAEAADRAKSVFLANMSHEIRTPMNAALGFSHLLRADLTEPEQLAKLDKINRSIKHLLGLISDILDLSKIEADHMQLEVLPFQLLTIVDHACSMMGDRVAQAGLELREELDPRLADAWVFGDPTRMGQVLINLLSNAAKFTPQGQIIIRVQVQQERGDELLLHFEVEDSGIGITPEQQSRLFQPFEQADAATTRKFGGTGLGLAISRRLIRLMGGDIGVRSIPGQGSTFWFSLPMRRASAGQPVQEESVLGIGQAIRPGARVLVVEDNALNREVAEALLTAVDLEVHSVENGAEAVTEVQRDTFDLILMDVQMPVMDGLEATRRIRATAAGRNLPILALTANAFQEDRHHCLQAGMNGFVTKPVEPDRLYAILAHWLPADGVAPTLMASTERPEPSESGAGAGERVLNKGKALHYVAGNEDVLDRLLGEFTERHRHDVDEIRDALARGDRLAAQRCAHTLKGVAATLGLESLSRHAKDVERAIRRNDDALMTSYLATLAASLSEALTAIADQPDGLAESLSAGTTSLALLRPSLDALCVELETDDMRATTTWQALRPLLLVAEGHEFVFHVDQSMRHWDFPAALQRLRPLLLD